MTNFNLEMTQVKLVTTSTKVPIMALVEALEALSPVFFSQMNGSVKNPLLLQNRT